MMGTLMAGKMKTLTEGATFSGKYSRMTSLRAWTECRAKCAVIAGGKSKSRVTRSSLTEVSHKGPVKLCCFPFQVATDKFTGPAKLVEKSQKK